MEFDICLQQVLMFKNIEWNIIFESIDSAYNMKTNIHSIQ